MSRFIFSVGIPGSGKTTFMKELAISLQASYICPDDIRLELTGDAANQSQNELVWNKVFIILKTKLLESKNVVIDATFTKPEVRRKHILTAKLNGASSIEAYVFNVHIDIALARNSSRERVVPEHVIKAMYQDLKAYPPRLSEGITKINYVSKDCLE